MGNSRPANLLITPGARQDLEDIWQHTAKHWSLEQADIHVDGTSECLNLLCHYPLMGREYAEFTPPVRVYFHATHLIVFQVIENNLKVIRTLHSRQSWRSILAR